MSKKITVVGAGVGGLTTACLLAQQGYDVTVFEAQTYPGGSASTFLHKGYRFESGATVAGGFHETGPHTVVGKLLNIDWRVKQHDPAWVVHLPQKSIQLNQNHASVLEAFPQSARFWQHQSQIAKQAWYLSAQGLPFPPRDIAELVQLAKVGLTNLPKITQIVAPALISVRQWLQWHHLAQDKQFSRFLDASLLISAQTTTPFVNALYGATALDLSRQGVYHVAGGIGGIAETLVNKLREFGGKVVFRHLVSRIVVQNGRAKGVMVKEGRRTTHEEFIPSDFVVVNNTPWSLDRLLGEDSPPSLRREVQHRAPTQGAFVLHLGIKADALPADFPEHHQIVGSEDGAMGEGNTVFVSLSPTWDTTRAPQGYRAVTISTHTRVQPWWDALAHDKQQYYERKETYAQKMLDLIDQKIPNFKASVDLMLPGSPVTYEHYTLRHQGMVGGFPQTSLFKARANRSGIPNIRLVGDSIFPGQSTAGVTLGAMRVAQDVQYHLPIQTHEKSLMPRTQEQTL